MKKLFVVAAVLVAFSSGLKAVEVGGGLVVCVGADALHSVSNDWKNPGAVFQCLETSEAKISSLRKKVQAAGCYGKVSVVQFDGKKLPYIDNLVSQIVVAGGKRQVASEEMLRVLAPLGSLTVNGKKTVKPWPAEIDEWTHYLHDSGNNAVANDTVVAPPKGMQWTNYPIWDRDHATLPGFASMVSAKGRVFTVEDRSPAAFPCMPGQFTLVARNAFNGIELWKLPLADWENVTHYMKGAPSQLNRRMVAVDDVVYATPGITAPVVAFNAADGKVLRKYEGTEDTQEIICHEGVLYLVVGDRAKNWGYESAEALYYSKMVFGEKHYSPRQKFLPYDELLAEKRKHSVVAVEAATGRKLWEISGDKTDGYEGVSLAVSGDKLVYQAGQRLFCLDRKTGKELWLAPVETSWNKRSHRSVGADATIVMKDGIVYRGDSDGLAAYALKDGKEVWRTKKGIPFGYMSSPDLFVANGAVWTQKSHAGLDPLTGEVVQQRGDSRAGPMGHDRCHRNKATERFIIESTSGGNDFSYLGSEISLSHPWVRNTCSMGGMPCNGLLYATAHACGCLSETLLNGVWALTGQRNLKLETGKLENPLVKGEAYNNLALKPQPADAWPTYRRDNARSGSTPTSVPSKLKVLWESKLPAGSTQPTIVDGKLYVASVDAHTVYSIDASNGKVLWSYIAGGRVDTPPTYHKGLLLFGSHDGWAYCLRASDGELAWKFKAAPTRECLACAYDQVESLWPLNGSVLVLNDVAYISAGRSTFLDGGIILYALDPATGMKLHEKVVAGPYEEGSEPIANPGKRTAIFGNKNEILVTDGKLIYLSHWAFTPELERVEDMEKHEDHLVTGSFMLDDSKHHRGFWTMARIVSSSRRLPQVASPDGDLIVFDGKNVFGTRFSPTGMSADAFDPRENGLDLFSMTAHGKEELDTKGKKGKKGSEGKRKGKSKKALLTPVSKFDYSENWRTGIQVNAEAMLMDGNNLFLAGKPNEFPEDDIFKGIEGRMGGLLVVASKKDGRELARYELEDVPAWDGMSAADGKLFISLKNGTLICFGGK